MEHIPARRGRPPASQSEAPETAIEAAAAPVKRRRRASVGGHAQRLGAPERPGYTRRWVNDAENRIAEIDELAYEFVSERGIQTNDPSSRIARTVGTKPNGEPLRAYLMETPDELYAEGVAEKEAFNGKVDEAIRKGRYAEGHGGDTAFGSGSIKQVER